LNRCEKVVNALLLLLLLLLPRGAEGDCGDCGRGAIIAVSWWMGRTKWSTQKTRNDIESKSTKKGLKKQ